MREAKEVCLCVYFKLVICCFCIEKQVSWSDKSIYVAPHIADRKQRYKQILKTSNYLIVMKCDWL